MVQRVEGLIFEIEVDPKTGEARLRNFSRSVEREGRKIGRSAKSAAQNISAIRNAILGVVGVAAGLQAARVALRSLGQEVGRTTSVAGSFQLQSQQLLTLLQLQGVEGPRAAREELIEYADALGLASSASSDQLIRAEALAISFGVTADRAKEAALASVLFSQVFTKGDIEPAIRNVVRSLGGYKEELISSVPGVRELTTEQLKQGKVIDLIIQQYSGLENALGFTLPIATQQSQEALDLLRRTIGGPLAEVSVEFLNVLTDTTIELNDAVKAAESYRVAIIDSAIAVVEFAVGVDETIKVVREWLPTGLQFGSVFSFIADRAMGATDELFEFFQLVGKLNSQTSDTDSTLKDLLSRLEAIRDVPREGAAPPPGVGGVGGLDELGIATVPGVFQELGFGLDAIAGARDTLTDATDAWRRFSQQVGDDSGLIDQGIEKLFELKDRLVELGLPLEDINAAFAEFGIQFQEFNKIDGPLAINNMDLLRGALEATSSALLDFAQSGQASLRSLVNAVARQTFAILSALAIENVIRGATQKALALGRFAVGDVAGGTLHAASAAAHFKAAATAGVLAAGALAGVALTGGGGSGGGGGGGSGSSPARDLADLDSSGQTITIVIEGQGFINEPEEFYRELASGIERELTKGGRRG